MFTFSLEHPIAWTAVFGNDRRVEVEIGPGRGERILAAAAAAPGINHLGIEKQTGAADAITARARRRGLANLRVLGGDVRWILRLVADASVVVYHVHFPDPWPKTRHRERRLATPTLARELARTLVDGGVVHVASDLPVVVAGFVAAFTGSDLAAVPGATPPTDRPKSSFEQRYAQAGVAYARFTRVARGTGGSGSR